MSLIVLLDAGPLGMITNPKSSSDNEAPISPPPFDVLACLAIGCNLAFRVRRVSVLVVHRAGTLVHC
jgi:hypothetical protein